MVASTGLTRLSDPCDLPRPNITYKLQVKNDRGEEIYKHLRKLKILEIEYGFRGSCPLLSVAPFDFEELTYDI